MYDIVQQISGVIERQFPAIYREEGQNLIAFVKAYYEWLEQSNNSLGKSRNLFDIRDIDTTGTEFIDYFRKKYLYGLPKSIDTNVDPRFIQKHILDLYRSKGSAEGVRLLFRLLYNEDINLYVPAKDVLKASDGVWIQPKYIEVSNNPSNYLYEGKLITGSSSGATAYVSNYKRIYIDDKIAHVFYVTNISGAFSLSEQIYCEGVNQQKATYILGSPVSLEVNFGTPNQPIGDRFISDPEAGKTRISGIVANSYDVTDGFINFVVVNGGTKYSQFSSISVTQGSNTAGYNAGFTGFTLSDTENFTYNTNLINYFPYDDTKYFNPYRDIVDVLDFIEIANCQFSNGDLVRYQTALGNTAVSGLSNTSYYYVVEANNLGLKLSSTYTYKSFNANADVNTSTNFISITSNPFSNGMPVRYVVSNGNSALSGLANNSYYYAIYANSSGLKLANSYSPLVTFNPSLVVNTEIDNYMILISNNSIANNTILRYVTSPGNTAISTLANNSYYYVVEANSIGIKLSSSSGGAAINLYSTSIPSEDGHFLYGSGTPITLTKGNTETGHVFYGSDSPISIAIGSDEYGHSITGVGVTFDSNSGVDDSNDFLLVANNLFADGDRVRYHVAPGNTSLTALSNNTLYWVVGANSTGLKLANTYNGTAMNLSKGYTESGHSLTGVSLVETTINVASFGSNLLNQNSNSTIENALTDNVVIVGTITRLTGLNPGRNYDGDVTVRVRDNYTASYGLIDLNGRVEGDNSNVVGRAVRGNDIPQLLSVKDSGFGYNTQGEPVVVSNIDDPDKTVNANVVLGAVGTSNGYWMNDKGKLSDFPKLHDNYYYQEFSYEIQSNKTLDKYLDILKQVTHQVGNIPFGKPVLTFKKSTPITIVNTSVTQA